MLVGNISFMDTFRYSIGNLCYYRNNSNLFKMIIGINGKIGSGKDTIGKIIQYLTNPFDRDLKTSFNIDEDYSAGNNWEIKKFADKLKDIVCILLNCTREQLENREFKEKELGKEWWYWKVYSDIRNDKFELIPYNGEDGFYDRKSTYEGHRLIKLTPRLLLQLLGTECGRQIIHPNIWINALMSEYKPKKSSIGINKWGKQTIVDKYPNWVITDLRFPNELSRIKLHNGYLIKIVRPGYVEKTSNHYSENALDDYSNWDFTITNDGNIDDLIYKVKTILTTIKII